MLSRKFLRPWRWNKGVLLYTRYFDVKKETHFIWVNFYLSTKVQIEETTFTSPTGDGTAIFFTWSSEPSEGLAVCTAKAVPSFLSYLRTLSIGPAQEIEPATSRIVVSALLQTELVLARSWMVQLWVNYVLAFCNWCVNGGAKEQRYFEKELIRVTYFTVAPICFFRFTTEYCLNSSAEEQRYFENSNSKRNSLIGSLPLWMYFHYPSQFFQFVSFALWSLGVHILQEIFCFIISSCCFTE